MVARVYGHVEGVEVIFTPSDGDFWTCVVPKTLNGEYVIELFADDDAGNTAYFATVLFAVNIYHVITKFKVLRHASDPRIERFRLIDKTSDYRIFITRCELCGGAVFGDH